MGLPQWIILGLIFISLLLNAHHHGETRKYNFWYVLSAAGIEITLLIWGGFFG